jgi:hypothetical protein
VAIRVEGDVDAGMSHLIANVCCGLAVGDKLTCEKVAEIVISCAAQVSAIQESALPTLRSARSLMTLSVAEMPRSDFRDFGSEFGFHHRTIEYRGTSDPKISLRRIPQKAPRYVMG